MGDISIPARPDEYYGGMDETRAILAEDCTGDVCVTPQRHGGPRQSEGQRPRHALEKEPHARYHTDGLAPPCHLYAQQSHR